MQKRLLTLQRVDVVIVRTQVKTSIAR